MPAFTHNEGSMSTRNSPTPRPNVIVRSFGDEPVILVAHRLDKPKNRVFVGKAEATRPISLPVDDVFDYEPDVFTRLSESFSQRNQDALRQIYHSLRGKKPCNKYQDALRLVHENEPEITNLRGVA
jgi:hypothetical protein